MTNSATSTNAGRPAGGSGFQAWHFFTLLSMIGATAVVMVSRETHPIALVLLSAAVIAAGFVGLTLSRAVSGFFSRGVESAGEPLATRSREELEKQKALVLRSIKELEFDKAMGKVSDADFTAIMGRLRARALTVMQDLEREPAPPPKAKVKIARGTCAACGTVNDGDARFCKSCGARLEGGQ